MAAINKYRSLHAGMRVTLVNLGTYPALYIRPPLILFYCDSRIVRRITNEADHLHAQSGALLMPLREQ